MKRFSIFALFVLSVGAPAIALAQWVGAPGTPPNSNTRGPVWLQSGTATVQTGKISISDDLHLSDTKALRVDKVTPSVFNVGNWYGGTSRGVDLNVYGDISSLGDGGSGGGTLSSDNICLAGDCRSVWPAGGGSSPWSLNGTKAYYNSGYVGVGTSDPEQAFQVNSNTEILSTGAGAGYKFRKRGSVSSGDDWVWYSDDVGGAGTAHLWKSGTGSIINVSAGGSVAIGTATPSAQLQVEGNGVLTTGSLSGYTFRKRNSIAAADDWVMYSNDVGGSNTAHLWENGSGDMFNFTTGGYLGLGVNPLSRLQLANNAQSPPASALSYSPYQILLWDTGDARTSYGIGIENNAMWYKSASNFKFYSGSTNNVDLSVMAGNVGVGTVSPNTKLHVYSPSSVYTRIDSGATSRSAQVHFFRGGSNNSYVGPSSGNTYDVWSAESIPMVFGTANTERMRITATGNVGIGNTAPTAKLMAVTTDTSQAAAHFVTSGTGTTNALRVQDGDAINYIGGDTINSTDVLQLQTPGYTNDITMVMGGGRVGIGDLTPSAKLHVTNSDSTVPSGYFESPNSATVVLRLLDDTNLMTLGGNEINVTPGTLEIHNSVGTGVNLVRGGGRVGVGVLSPSAKLDVVSGISTLIGANINGPDNDGSIAALRVVGGGNNMLIDGNEIDSDAVLYLQHNSTNNLRLASGGGSVSIGNISPLRKLHVDGDIRLNGSIAEKVSGTTWTATSDIRLKDVLGSYSHGLDEISKLNPIYYKFKKNNAKHISDNETHVGFSAQEVEKVIPEAVSMDSDGYRQLNADPILWAMVNSIKDLKTQNDELRARIEKLEAAQ
jgi:hypothetical protein